ncbi:PEBP-like protein, partial [Calocera viscosa TUFC12733]
MHAARRAASALCSRGPAVLRRVYTTPSSAPSADPSAASTSSDSSPPSPPTYTPPLSPGQLEIYDLSLSLLLSDKARKLDQLSSLRAELPTLPADAQALAQKKLSKLEVDAEINDPEVRWRHKRGLGDLSLPVYRYLREAQWRKEGALDLLMERLWQMHVLPDVLPWVDPTVEMRVRFQGGEDVEPGGYLTPEHTEKEPEIYTTAFHMEERYYTLVMVDPDVPSPATSSYTTFLHWLIPNIPLTCLSPSPLPLPPALQPYIPPHPQAGTPYHRYTLLLLPQRGLISRMKAPLRRGFSLRDFVRTYDLTGGPVQGAPPRALVGAHKGAKKGPKVKVNTGAEVGGGGAHMFREVWDESVPGIHERAFGTPELRYGKPKTVDPYLDEEGVRPRRYY